jgi:hypothetical protein
VCDAALSGTEHQGPPGARWLTPGWRCSPSLWMLTFLNAGLNVAPRRILRSGGTGCRSQGAPLASAGGQGVCGFSYVGYVVEERFYVWGRCVLIEVLEVQNAYRMRQDGR